VGPRARSSACRRRLECFSPKSKGGHLLSADLRPERHRIHLALDVRVRVIVFPIIIILSRPASPTTRPLHPRKHRTPLLPPLPPTSTTALACHSLIVPPTTRTDSTSAEIEIIRLDEPFQPTQTRQPTLLRLDERPDRRCRRGRAQRAAREVFDVVQGPEGGG